MTDFIGLSKSLPISTLIATQLWFESSSRAGSYFSHTHTVGAYPNEHLLANIGFGDIHGLPVFTGFLDLAPRPTALTREQTDEAMGGFTMELDHENELFDHSEYGDVPDGIAPHISDMRPLDRVIFEDCVPSAGRVQAPHLNLNDVQYYKRPETIARQCECDITEAKCLCEAWRVIGDTEDLVHQYIRWTQIRGIEAAITYFVDLADQLIDAERGANGAREESNHVSVLAELDQRPQNIRVRKLLKHISDDEIRVMDLLWNIADDIDAQFNSAAAEEIEAQDLDGIAPDVMKYHPIGESMEPEPDYYDMAPRNVIAIYAHMRRIDDFQKLASYGKVLYEKDLGKHTGTMWMHYNQRKAALTPKRTEKAEAIIQFIGRCNRQQIGRVGKRLYELQMEQPDTIHATDWSGIWAAYREKKQEFYPQQAVQRQAA